MAEPHLGVRTLPTLPQKQRRTHLATPSAWISRTQHHCFCSRMSAAGIQCSHFKMVFAGDRLNSAYLGGSVYCADAGKTPKPR